MNKVTRQNCCTASRFRPLLMPHRIYRRNGATKTWKTRPDEFRIPVKFGLYDYGAITHDNASDWEVVE